MKVGFLIDRWDPARGGAERALAAFARRLEQRGDEVLAVALEGPPPGADRAPGRLVRVPARGLGRAARARALAEDLPRAAREAGCELTVGVRHLAEVDLFWPHGGAHGPALAARRRARGEDPSRPPHGRHRTFIDLERELLESGRARRVVCVSELVRDELERLYPACADRTVVVENGVDLARFDPELNRDAGDRLRASLALGRGTPLLVFAARDPVLKGLGPLARGLAGLRERPWHLLVAGPRHLGTWRRLLAREGVPAARVTVRAHVEREALFAAADLCVHPTYRDPCPLVVLESLAAGTPVITTRCAGNAGLIGPAAGAVIDGPEAGAALAAALEHWLTRVRRPGDRVDRQLVRAAVARRTESDWLDRLEQQLRSLR